MSPRSRSLLRAIFILTFLTIAPALILSTAGYRYSFGKGRLERTGVLYVDSVPSGASVYLNDKHRKEKTPARLTKLAPGTYQVRVELPGSQPWVKEVEVVSGLTTFLDDLILFKQGVPLISREMRAEVSSFSPDGNRAALVSSTDGWQELRVVDASSGEDLAFARFEGSSSEGFAFSWTDDGRRLLIARLLKKGPAFLAWDDRDRLTFKDVGALLPSKRALQAFWSSDGSRLYAADHLTLHEIDPTTWTRRAAGPAVPGMTESDGIFYGVARRDTGDAASFALVRRAPQTAVFEDIARLPGGDYASRPGPDGMLLAVQDSGDAFIIIDPSRPVREAVRFEGHGTGFALSSDGNRLLYWNDIELRVFTAANGQDALVTRLGEGIIRAAWYPAETLIFFATGREARVIESDAARKRGSLRLTSFSDLKNLALAEDGETLRFVGTIGQHSGLWTMAIR
jgi:hypothetical protein